MKLVERTKMCNGCEVVKPWSAFRARTRWEDGTPKTVQSRCRECERVGNAARMRSRYWADRDAHVDRIRAFRERVLADPETAAEYRARQREYDAAYRRKQGEEPRQFRDLRLAVDTEPRERIDGGPWRAWVTERRVVVHHGCTSALARELGVSERQVRDWLTTTGKVGLDSVDRCLTRINLPGVLYELWPDLVMEDAA